MLALSNDRADDVRGEELEVILIVWVTAIIREYVRVFLAFSCETLHGYDP